MRYQIIFKKNDYYLIEYTNFSIKKAKCIELVNTFLITEGESLEYSL